MLISNWFPSLEKWNFNAHIVFGLSTDVPASRALCIIQRVVQALLIFTFNIIIFFYILPLDSLDFKRWQGSDKAYLQAILHDREFPFHSRAASTELASTGAGIH